MNTVMQWLFVHLSCGPPACIYCDHRKRFTSPNASGGKNMAKIFEKGKRHYRGTTAFAYFLSWASSFVPSLDMSSEGNKVTAFFTEVDNGLVHVET